MSDTVNTLQSSRVEADDESVDENEHDEHVDTARKRKRSLRKGTHSCWACKRRKEKCTFSDSDVCNGCLRRGTKCVSQQFADNNAQATPATTVATATRLQRIEDMVARLTSQIQGISQSQRNPLYTPMTSSSSSPMPRAILSQTTPLESEAHSASPVAANDPIISTTGLDGLSKLQVLSQTLYSSLPCPQDIQLLRKASSRHPVLSTIHIAKSYTTLRRDGIQPTDGVLQEPPLATSEPVLIAKYMLQIAVSLQEMQHTTYLELHCLVESAATLIERCARTAITLVTRQDDLLGSIESLEGVVLESVYQCNSGRLRLSWMAVQRAMLLARTLGLHLVGCNSNRREALHFLDPNGIHPELPNLWFRIIQYNLQLSRMLGLPPGAAETTDNALSPYDMMVETPEGYVDQIYCHVMTHALALKSSGTNPPDARAMQELDQELQRAASSIPSQWWLPPNLAKSSNSPLELFWDMRKLITQMLHHDLRNQLYVPCMLSKGEENRQCSEMARIACANSSREILSRFILLRDFNWTASSCRFANFLGLMAAITLVLAHLGGNRPPHLQNQDGISSQIDTLLSHQELSDRAMMEQALETMQRMGNSSADALCAQSANVLRLLLDIKANNSFYIADNNSYVSVDSQPAAATLVSATEKGEHIFIPYFGVMQIVRPNSNNAASEITTTAAAAEFDARAETETRYSEAYNSVDLVDPLLLDLRDEQWMSQNINITFLDTFLERRI